MVVVWSKRARKDLTGIWEYYYPRNLRAAVKIMQAIRSTERKIANNPRIAPVELELEDFPQGFRSIVVKKLHKIVYFINDNEIRISAVWDCRRNPDTLRSIVKHNNGTD